MLTVVDLYFLCKVRCAKQYMFMIQLLAFILTITFASTAMMIMNSVLIKNQVSHSVGTDIVLGILNFMFWVSTYFCVWLVALKYHE